MRPAFPRILFRVLKIGGITIVSLVALLFLLPYIFPNFVSGKIRQWARHKIQTELHFSAARLSFFRHFPALTLTLYDVKLNGSKPFPDDKLVLADEIALGVDLRSIFTEVTIDKIFITNARINIQVDSSGLANYNIYASKPAAARTSDPSDSSSASLRIKQILFEKCGLVYNDRSLGLLINARGLNYEGNGDLDQAVFDLHTHMGIDSMDLSYDKMAYFVNKKINADLITKINTNSLAFLFEKNELVINQLPVTLTGHFAFLKDGYDMDFRLHSTKANLHDFFTALPPDMLNWMTKTEIKGTADMDASLIGQYNAATNTMPNLNLNMQVHDGYVAYQNAPAPVSQLFLDFRSTLPGLNPDSLQLSIDSVFFKLDKDYFSAIFNMKGLTSPWISARVRSEMDLEKWDKAMGFAPADLKGRYTLQLQAEGRYETRVEKKTTLRKVSYDTVLASIPSFKLVSSLRDGFVKYASQPEAVQQLNFNLDASCADKDYHHIRLNLSDLNAEALTSHIKGFFRLEPVGADIAKGQTRVGVRAGSSGAYAIDAALSTVLHLEDVKKVYPLDSMELAGNLSVDLKSIGEWSPAKKKLPVTVANLQLTDGRVQTKYYPHPIERIQVAANIVSPSGSMKDLSVAVTPVAFLFEGQPFTLRADLHDFSNLRYNIASQGTLDLGRIIKVFALKGYEVSGLVETNLSLRGRESDAQAGRYDLLYNKGSMKVKEVQVSSELFPLPLNIHTGLFRFDQDKMWFDAFDATYGKTRFTLNGWLTDVIGYMTNTGKPLQGRFELSSDYLLASQLMAFGATTPASGGSGAGASRSVAGGSGSVASLPAPAGTTGVILVPSDLVLSFYANVRKINYNGLDIDSFKGGVTIDSATVRLDTTSFVLAGANVAMNATYKSQSPQKASFDYHIAAKDFDVQRAYKEVKLFRDMATSAAKAQGIISLDYKLSGRLDANMHPVYPSLKGGGVLSVRKVKVKGMRLFGAVSKETNRDVNDPDLSKVEIKTTINNNIITLERTRMKVSVFKLRMEGQASFDGRLNLHFRLGLPPFGVIGIPLSITGTQENPIVHARRASKKDELEETEDKDEDGKTD